jgi:hypothetical protein
VVALAGLVALVAFFNGRDSGSVSGPSGPGTAFRDLGARHLPAGHGPVRYASDPPTSGPHAVAATARDGGELSDDQLLTLLERGNVVLLYGAAQPPAALRSLQDAVAGPFDPAVAAAGQAVALARRAGTTGVVALAWTRMLRTSSPADPALRAFAEAWLGRGAQR